MKAYALLGGPKQEWPQDIKNIFKQAKVNGDLIIGVDRGCLLLEELGIIPDLAVGDFDSLKKNELKKIEATIHDIRYSNPVKDLTDSELMIQAAFLDYQVSELNILGATGGRLDHFLVNLMMILNPKVRKFAEKINLIDLQNKICFYLPGKHKVKKDLEYPYFGVANLGVCKNLNIKDAKYLLNDFSSSVPRVFSSNEFLPDREDFSLAFDQGTVAIIYSKDQDRFYNV